MGAKAGEPSAGIASVLAQPVWSLELAMRRQSNESLISAASWLPDVPPRAGGATCDTVFPARTVAGWRRIVSAEAAVKAEGIPAIMAAR